MVSVSSRFKLVHLAFSWHSQAVVWVEFQIGDLWVRSDVIFKNSNIQNMQVLIIHWQLVCAVFWNALPVKLGIRSSFSQIRRPERNCWVLQLQTGKLNKARLHLWRSCCSHCRWESLKHRTSFTFGSVRRTSVLPLVFSVLLKLKKDA